MHEPRGELVVITDRDVERLLASELAGQLIAHIRLSKIDVGQPFDTLWEVLRD